MWRLSMNIKYIDYCDRYTVNLPKPEKRVPIFTSNQKSV